MTPEERDIDFHTECLDLMDRLDSLFYTISKHDWNVPKWMLLELRLTQSQYRKINELLEVSE